MDIRPIPGGWAQAVEQWLTYLKASGKPQGTVKLRCSQIRRLGEAYPDTGPFTLTTDHLTSWLGAHDWAAETLRSHRAALRSFYGWAHVTGRTGENPAALLPRVRPAQGKPRPAPDSIIRSSRLRADHRDGLMIRLAAEAGLRCCEIARVHSDDIEPDLVGWSLRVHGKGDKVRLIPLGAGLAAALRHNEPGYLFPGRINGHLSPAYVSKRLSRALAGSYTGHQLRHRFGTVAYAAQRDLFAVQELLGHASPETTRKYVLLPRDAIRAAAEAAAC